MPKPFLQFDSSRLKTTDAEEMWRESLRAIYEIKRSRKVKFEAKILTWNVGEAMLLTQHVAYDEVHFQRTRKRIATSGVDQYLIHTLIAGELISTSSNGEQKVPLNSVAVRDMSVENIGLAKNAPMLTLSIPRSALDKRLPEGARLHGACFAEGDPVGGLVAGHIKNLANLITEMTDEQAHVAAGATLDLLAACLLSKSRMVESRDTSRLGPMLQAQAYAHIEQHLFDPGLDASSLCNALKVSRTVLYELFSEAGGIAKLVKGKRLDEAMRRLTNSRHPRLRISEIAFATGFASEATFSRAFRERFGCTPSEAREEGLTSTLPTTNADKLEVNAPHEYEAAIRKLGR